MTYAVAGEQLCHRRKQPRGKLLGWRVGDFSEDVPTVKQSDATAGVTSIEG